MLTPNRRGLAAAPAASARSHRLGRLAPLLAFPLLTACVSYESAPLDPSQILQDLDRVTWSPPVSTPSSTPSEGLSPRELAALAVTHQPALRALRAEVGVASARLVEAGLLPDPTVGWGAMDVVAAQIDTGSSGSQEVISGFGVMFPLLRPGERDARIGTADSRRTEILLRVLRAEWILTREVYLASVEVAAAERLLAQTTELLDLANSTGEYFERAREAGAATAIQTNLAQGQLFALDLERVTAQARVRAARQSLNALVGLPPEYELRLTHDEDPAARADLERTTAELTASAVQHRPDLAELLARYQTAEQGVRLAVAQQYPLIAIGTGISISPGIFSKFARPAIDTALARRERLARVVEALIHEIRRDISAASVRLQTARQELESIEMHLLPNAEATLEFSRVAFEAGEMTLLESLALQRLLVEARTRHTEARADVSRSAWALLSASGLLLTPTPSTATAREEGSR